MQQRRLALGRAAVRVLLVQQPVIHGLFVHGAAPCLDAVMPVGIFGVANRPVVEERRAVGVIGVGRAPSSAGSPPPAGLWPCGWR